VWQYRYLFLFMEGPKRVSTFSSRKSLPTFKCFGVGLLLQRLTYLSKISFLEGRVFLSKMISSGVPFKGSTHEYTTCYNFTHLKNSLVPTLYVASTLSDMVFVAMIEEVFTSVEKNMYNFTRSLCFIKVLTHIQTSLKWLQLNWELWSSYCIQSCPCTY
jgi:hypothetical protein